MDAAFPSITAPRLVVSGLSGGGGKTLLSLGLARALTLRGLRVKPCKKGPDYIDAAWLGLASGRTPTNLDPFFLTDARLRALLHLIRRCRPLPPLKATGACTTGATWELLHRDPRPRYWRARPAYPHGHQDDPHRRRGHCRAGPLRARQSRGRGPQPCGFLTARRPHPAKHRIHRHPVLKSPGLPKNPIRGTWGSSLHDETDALSLLAALDALAGLIERHMDIDAAPAPRRSADLQERRTVLGRWERMPLSKRAPFGKAPAKLLRVPMRRLRKPISEKRSSPPAILRSPIMSGYPPKRVFRHGASRPPEPASTKTVRLSVDPLRPSARNACNHRLRTGCGPVVLL